MIVPGPLRRLDVSLNSAAENVALDDWLLRSAETLDLPGVLRIWELRDYAVVVGRANRVDRNVDVAACREDRVPIIRRSSGGGTVLLGPGALVFSIVLRIASGSRLAEIDQTTRLIMERTRAQLAAHVPGAAREGVSDLAVGSLKFSGNAQRWLRSAMLHHGTLLYDFDISRMARYLKPPEREPGYRMGRSHTAFVQNLPVAREGLVGALVAAWEARLPAGAVDLAAVRGLVREQFGRGEWTFRR